MVGRKSGFDIQNTAGCNGLPSNKRFYQATLTTLTFTGADGTEYDFRDQSNGGQRMTVSGCPEAFPYTGALRGRVWVTTDSSSATFVSDSDIYDARDIPSSTRTFTPSGILMLKDDTRYRIDAGTVKWIRDRNGNQVTFGTNGAFATDSLGRGVTVEYDVTDTTYGLCDRIHVSGMNGADRTIYVTKTNLANILSSGYSLQSRVQLFPELNGAANFGSGGYDPTLVSGVMLPDGRSYQFRYNSYGELAWVTLPTGGAIEYVMSTGSGVVVGNNNETDAKEIYRRVAVTCTPI